MTPPLAADGRGVIVAIDHPLYSWPCRGLEDREALLRAVVGAGADAVIVSYGTLRDCRDALGRCGADPQARPHDADARGLRHDRVRGGLDGRRRAAPGCGRRADVRPGRHAVRARGAAARRARGRRGGCRRGRLRLRDHARRRRSARDRRLLPHGRRARRARRQDVVPAAGLGDRRRGRLRHPGRAGRRRSARSRAFAGRRRRRDGGRRGRRRLRPQRLGRGRSGGDGARPRPDRPRRGGAPS